MRRLATAVLVALTAAASPALAHSASAAAGMLVKDMAGGDVGTVTAIDGASLMLKTDRHEVKVPVASTVAHNGSHIAMSRTELNAAADHALASAITVSGRATIASGAGAGSVPTPLDAASSLPSAAGNRPDD